MKQRQKESSKIRQKSKRGHSDMKTERKTRKREKRDKGGKRRERK